MGSIAPSKTSNVSILAMTAIASNTVVKSSAIDVSGKFAASIFCWLGRDDVGGVLAASAKILIQGSPDSSGDDTWQDLATFVSGLTVPEAEAVSGTEAAGETVIGVASTTNLVVGQNIFFKNATLSNSEFARIIALVANVSITVMDAIKNAQTGSTIYNQAEFFNAQLDLASMSRIRVVYDCSGTGRSVVGYARMTTLDQLATT